MPVHTVEALLKLKDKFKAKPYPTFSLDHCIALRNQAERLTRGTNAWGRSAVDATTAITKQVHGALNKLTPEKYNEIMAELKKPELLEPEPVKIFVRCMFEKALMEPVFSDMYARACFDMAQYELEQSSDSRGPTPGSVGTPSSPNARKSVFRTAIVTEAQNEFQHKFAVLEGESDSDAALRQLKRKRANIKFVGHLFEVNMLADSIIRRIIDSILRRDDVPIFVPSEVDMEVLTMLMLTVGGRLEQSAQYMEGVMTRLHVLQERFPMRVRSKMMMVEDMRANGWVSREASRKMASAGSSSTLATPSSPNMLITPTRRAVALRFPESPVDASNKGVTPTGATAKPEPHKSWSAMLAAGRSSGGSSLPSSQASPASPAVVRSGLPLGPRPAATATAAAAAAPAASHADPSKMAASTLAPPAAAAAAAALPTVPMKKRAMDLYKEWQASHADCRGWMVRFRSYGTTEAEARAVIVKQVVWDACTTTRVSAQMDAVQFLTKAMALAPQDLLPGLQRVLLKAVETGAREDTPKFYDRLMSVLGGCFVSATLLLRHAVALIFDVYEDLARAYAANPAEAVDVEEAAQELGHLWTSMPQCKEAPEDEVAMAVIERRGTTKVQQELALELLHYAVKQTAILSVEPVNRWVKAHGAEAANADFVTMLKSKAVIA